MRRHIFVINPAAGQGEALALIPEIEAVCSVAGINYEIYTTAGIGDAERFARERCQELALESRASWSGGRLEAPDGELGAPDDTADGCDERRDAPDDAADGHDERADSPGEKLKTPGEDVTLRFYACGGDGTLNELVNGAAGYDLAEVGCIPAGTGNDFVRNFPEKDFDDLIGQIRGETCLCDLIRYEGVCDGERVRRYCVNMFNIGFDSNVVDMTARMKRMPLMNGSLAYLASVAAMLVEKKGADLRVEYPAKDGEGADTDTGTLPDTPAADNRSGVSNGGFVYDGKLLLIAVANGSFCGGGVRGLPRAVTDDGMFDVSLVRDIPRRSFVRLFPKYMEGTHLSDPRLDGVIRYTHETSLHITPNRGTMKLCVDGEIVEAGPIRFQICPGAFRFVLPAGHRR